MEKFINEIVGFSSPLLVSIPLRRLVLEWGKPPRGLTAAPEAPHAPDASHNRKS